MSNYPLIIEPNNLKYLLQVPEILVIDISDPSSYIKQHIPGAIFLEYTWLIHSEKPRMGLLPDTKQLSNVFGYLGITPDTHVVAYDDEGGGRASRLLWTLDCVGHTKISLLNGGILSWQSAGLSVTTEIHHPLSCKFRADINQRPVADKQYILEQLKSDQTLILDTRSPDEYNGVKVFAQRGGHIPGAINMNWVEAIDRKNDMRLRDTENLQALLNKKGVTKDKEIIVHCQSHHRSAHTYIMLKSLGYEKVKGYPGSWSDWGNDMNTPIETG